MDRDLKLEIGRYAVTHFCEELLNSDLALMIGEATPAEHSRLLQRVFDLSREKVSFESGAVESKKGGEYGCENGVPI